MNRLLRSSIWLFCFAFLFPLASGSARAATETQKLLALDILGHENYGYSVSVDGDTIVVGANNGAGRTYHSGAAYVFKRDASGNWVEVQKLTASDGDEFDKFGTSVSKDGDTIVVGAYGDGPTTYDASGSVYVFIRDASGNWTQQAKLTASDGAVNDYFGYSVSVSGDTIVVGAYGDDDRANWSGSAYVFERDASGNWGQVQKLLTPDGADYYDYAAFGISVSVSGDTIVAGGERWAYVFERDASGNWSNVKELTTSDGAEGPGGSHFGSSVSVDGGTIVVGAYNWHASAYEAYWGSAYVFERDASGAWVEVEKLTAFDGAKSDLFGCSVSVDGDTIVIGARYDDDDGDSSGSAYFFKRDVTGAWVSGPKLTSSDGSTNDQFGLSVSVDGDTIAVGAYRSKAYAFYGVTLNGPPVAEAGENQSIHAGDLVQLDGGGSSDDKTPSEKLLYAWSFTSQPASSTATLTGADTAAPSFTADLPGTYVVGLVVTDEGSLSSEPDEVIISSLNAPPNADAGPDQGAYVSEPVALDGSGSNDPDADLITFSWTLTGRPDGSAGALSGADTVAPTFVPDLPGAYEVELIVHDGFVTSAPDQVTVMVITAEDFAETQAAEAINVAGPLPATSVTTVGNQTALVNFLKQAIAALQEGDIAEARLKLQNALERTDGCALRGAPDSPGEVPMMQDYINNCSDQALVCPLLQDALTALEGA